MAAVARSAARGSAGDRLRRGDDQRGGDKALLVEGEPDWLLHLEFISGHDAVRLPHRVHRYNVLLDGRHNLLVRSVIVVLHPEADSPQLTGSLERQFPGEPPHATFRYSVMRVWQVPAERFLTGGVGLLPLAPIGAVARAELPHVLDRVGRRLASDADRGQARELGGRRTFCWAYATRTRWPPV